MKYLLPLSAWFAYIGYGVYVYFTSDGTLIDTLVGLFVSLFSPFWWLPTGVLALVALCLMATIPTTNGGINGRYLPYYNGFMWG